MYRLINQLVKCILLWKNINYYIQIKFLILGTIELLNISSFASVSKYKGQWTKDMIIIMESN